jgi:hypothetical protein
MKGGLVRLRIEEPRGSLVLDEDDGEAGRPSQKIWAVDYRQVFPDEHFRHRPRADLARL